MSYVTNAILIYDVADEEEYLANVNGMVEGMQRGKFVSVDDPKLPFDWYGGTKVLELGVAIAAFNHVDENDLLERLKAVNVPESDSVYLVLKSETDDFPRFIYIGGAA